MPKKLVAKRKYKHKVKAIKSAETEKKEDALNIDGTLDIIPPKAKKPSNDIDKGIVTLDEKEYQRLREIEDSIKELFTLAKKVNGAVAFGKLHPKYKEPKLITRLRELLGVEPYIQPTEIK